MMVFSGNTVFNPLLINHNLQGQQSIEDTIRILIDFLGEFLISLSSIIECKQFYSQCQLKKIVDIAERIHQLRLTLLMQINNSNECVRNIPLISQNLHELAFCIRYLSTEQQQIGSIIEHPHINMFSQLIDRLEKTIKSCIDCISMNTNPQNCQPSVPVLFPCSNAPCMIYNPSIFNGCCTPYNGPNNTCIPWSLLEQDHIFGVMYGIKDENVRRKLGYSTKKQKSLSRSKQKVEQNNLVNAEPNYDSDQEWVENYTNDQMLVSPKVSNVSTRQKLKSVEQTGISKKSDRISTNSTLSQKKNGSNRLSSNRTISRLQSLFNSKKPSSLFRSNLNINDPIKSRSIHDHLTVSNASGRMTTSVKSSHTKELPITSMLDHSESQRTSSRQMQQQPQQSNIFKDENDKSDRSSFQTYGYRTPSKTTIKMSRESSQSLSPIHSQHSNGSIQSRKTPSIINDVIENKSTSSIAKSIDKRSFKESSIQNPSIYSTHTNNIDSTISLKSRDKSKHNESISNKSWEQRLASPLSIVSAQRMNSSHLKQKSISPMSNKQLSLNETTSNSHFDDYSQHQMSPSTNSLIETNDNGSSMKMIEGPHSAEGEEIFINSSDNNNKRDISTSYFSLTNTIQQRSTSATSDSDDSVSISKTTKHSSQSMTKKKRKIYTTETTSIPFQSNTDGYFNTFMHCFRKTTANRTIYQYK